MSRVIKFRCWDHRAQKMWTPIIDKDGIPGVLHPVSGQLVRMDGVLLDPIMQFTGLKDKHGVEIWEGDIVSDPRVTYPLPPLCYSVVEEGHTGGWAPFEYDGGGEDDTGDVEVIGNIHQHPELLEGE